MFSLKMSVHSDGPDLIDQQTNRSGQIRNTSSSKHNALPVIDEQASMAEQTDRVQVNSNMSAREMDEQDSILPMQHTIHEELWVDSSSLYLKPYSGKERHGCQHNIRTCRVDGQFQLFLYLPQRYLKREKRGKRKHKKRKKNTVVNKNVLY